MNKRSINKKVFARGELSILSMVQFVFLLGGVFLYIDSLWLNTISESFNISLPLIGTSFNSGLTWIVNNIHHSIWGLLLMWQYLAGHKRYYESVMLLIILTAPIWLLQYGGLTYWPLVLVITAVAVVLVVAQRTN